MIALTQARIHAPARDYLARRRTDGKTPKEGLRALKRHLARHIYRLFTTIHKPRPAAATDGQRRAGGALLDIGADGVHL